MLTRAIGKNTLGDNNKMKVHLRTYNRSTHNPSHDSTGYTRAVHKDSGTKR